MPRLAARLLAPSHNAKRKSKRRCLNKNYLRLSHFYNQSPSPGRGIFLGGYRSYKNYRNYRSYKNYKNYRNYSLYSYWQGLPLYPPYLLPLKKSFISWAHSSSRMPPVTSQRGWSARGAYSRYPRFTSGAPYTTLRTCAHPKAPAHITQGSTVT